MLSLYGLVAMIAVLGLLLTVSALGSWDRRTDPSKRQRSVGDEAQQWLDHRGHGGIES